MSDEERLARRSASPAVVVPSGWWTCRMDTVVPDRREPSALVYVLGLEDDQGQPVTRAMGVTHGQQLTVRDVVRSGSASVRRKVLELARAFELPEMEVMESQSIDMSRLLGLRAIVRPKLAVATALHPVLVVDALAPHPLGPGVPQRGVAPLLFRGAGGVAVRQDGHSSYLVRPNP